MGTDAGCYSRELHAEHVASLPPHLRGHVLRAQEDYRNHQPGPPEESIPFPEMPREYVLRRSVPAHELLLVFGDDEHAVAFADWLADEGFDLFRIATEERKSS